MILAKRRNSQALVLSALFFALGALACQSKAPPEPKTLHLFFPAQPKSLDPILSEDAYSNVVNGALFESLFQYNYLKRPIVLEPSLAAQMPTLSDDGLTLQIDLKNARFADDPAFVSGVGRELQASDVVYSLKRLADAKLQSTGWWLLAGRIPGLDEFHRLSLDKTATNYDLDVVGLSALSEKRLQIKLLKPSPQLLYALAMPYTGVVAREVVEKYGEEITAHPVGSGPFRLASMNREHELVLTKNPHYRQERHPITQEPLPLLDKVVYHVYKETSPRWLNFLKGNLDLGDIPKDVYATAITTDLELQPALKNNGIKLFKDTLLDLTYIAFNMQDPLLGKNVNLRRAMSLATDSKRRIEFIFNGRALPAQGPIPPGLSGHDPTLVNPYRQFDLAKAREHLTLAGYPHGQGLAPLKLEGVASNDQRQADELFIQQLKAIGIPIDYHTSTWPELIAKINKRQAPIFLASWVADYPDAENFLALFYSRNATPGSNQTNYHNPAFDKLYEEAALLLESPRRLELYQKMARLVIDDVPMIFGEHRIRYTLMHEWVEHYQPHPIRHGMLKYYAVDDEIRRRRKPKL